MVLGQELKPTLGKGVKVGVVEGIAPDGTAGVSPALTTLGDRLKKSLDFRDVNLPVRVDPPNSTKDAKHTSLVADTIAGSDPDYTSVAPAAEIYNGVTPGSKGLRGGVDWLNREYQVHIFNHSYNAGASGLLTDDYASFLDYHARVFDTIHVIGAGNNQFPDAPFRIGSPGDSYNGITVGALDESLQARAGYSSYWLRGDSSDQTDIRGKPDILAPGGGVGNSIMSNGLYKQSGTSFATPHVTGVVALLFDADLPNRLVQGPSSHLAAKAIILNSARKRFMVGGENAANAGSLDNDATKAHASDADYLNAGGGIRANSSTAAAPKTAGWTPSNWTTNAAGVLTVTSPYDDEQGVGVVDAERAILQHQAGKQAPGNVTRMGWDVNRTSPAAGAKEYRINANLTNGKFLTVTLCWDQLTDETDGSEQVDEPIRDYETRGEEIDDNGIIIGLGGVPNYNLRVYKDNVLIAESVAPVSGGNVEHLHVPLPSDGDSYRLEVKLDGPATVTKTYPYAIAWMAGE